MSIRDAFMKLYSQLVLASLLLVFGGGCRTIDSNADAGPVPNVFFVFVGHRGGPGFLAKKRESGSVEFRRYDKGKIVYKRFRKVSSIEWKEFFDEFEKIEMWRLKAEYSAESPEQRTTGMHAWKIEIEYDGRKVLSRGKEWSFPSDDDLNRRQDSVILKSFRFIRFEKALEALLRVEIGFDGFD